jgi:hypothetical protein
MYTAISKLTGVIFAQGETHADCLARLAMLSIPRNAVIIRRVKTFLWSME